MLAALAIGMTVAPGRVEAQAAPEDLGAQIDEVAVELAGLDDQVTQLRASLDQLEADAARADEDAQAIREESTSQEQLQARLVAQARSYALQRYMYGSSESRDLLAFLSALNKPADDAVWGLATLEVTSEAVLDEAQQVATARAEVEDRLAIAESDVLLLDNARARRTQELNDAAARRNEVAARFEAVVRELGQATVNGMSTVAYNAYRQAEATLAEEQPGCGLRWELLAAIGKTESNHGAGRLDAFGNSMVAIIGIPIGGDTDGGTLDGDPGRDHAVGPMQFIPSTWKRWTTDANGDGKGDPGNIVDSATAAGRYLCRAAGDLTLQTEAGVIRAILAYNPNQTYLRVVGARFESLAADLASGWFSAAALPPAPAPVADLPPNAGPDGRVPDGGAPIAPEPATTTVTEVRVFGAQDLVGSTTVPLEILPGECLGPSLVLDGRDGFLRCRPQDGPQLDPCEVAPYDTTLVACLPDPTGTPTFLRLSTAEAAPTIGPPPPYRLLMLDGGDRCLPIPATEPARPRPGGPPDTTTSTAPTTGAPTSTTADPATTSTSPETTSTAPATTTTEPTTTTTEPATTVAPPATTVPLAERRTYTCASGVTIIGVPDTSTASWLVLARQPGLTDRHLAVLVAYS